MRWYIVIAAILLVTPIAGSAQLFRRCPTGTCYQTTAPPAPRVRYYATPAETVPSVEVVTKVVTEEPVVVEYVDYESTPVFAARRPILAAIANRPRLPRRILRRVFCGRR